MTDLKKIPPRCEFDQSIATVKLDELIPSDTCLIEGVVSKVVRLIGEDTRAQDSENVELALQEALMNAILHGNRNDPEKYVRICVAVEDGGGILIVVKDCGPGFDPGAIPNPTLKENIYREGGRGLYLISQLMDEVHYKFENGTTVYMRRYPPGRRK